MKSSRLDNSIDGLVLKDHLTISLKRFASNSDEMKDILDRFKDDNLRGTRVSITEAKGRLCSILQIESDDRLAIFVNDNISDYEAYLPLSNPEDFIV
ncbi:MAG: hypothetical protein U9Q62_08450 [Campylobacterota bacterium]|nr:hypothetical protein [Campylobacterota bacterium]